MGSLFGGGDRTTKTTSEFKLDPEFKKIMEDQYQRALGIGSLGYVPYDMPTIAGFSDQEIAGMRAASDAGAAFGMASPDVEIPKGPNVGKNFMGMMTYNVTPHLWQAQNKMLDGRKDAIARYFNNLRTQSGLWDDNANRAKNDPDKQKYQRNRAVEDWDTTDILRYLSGDQKIDLGDHADVFNDGNLATSLVDYFYSDDKSKIDLTELFGK